MSIKWLDRRIAAPAPYLTLCLSESDFKQALKHCKIYQDCEWIKTKWSHATAHHLDNGKGERVCIVCINASGERTPIEIAGLLVHEAVHVWQDYCARIGEDAPGVEQEAYGIQSIAQELMSEYARRIREQKI